jgi:hypothetical protein
MARRKEAISHQDVVDHFVKDHIQFVSEAGKPGKPRTLRVKVCARGKRENPGNCKFSNLIMATICWPCRF